MKSQTNIDSVFREAEKKLKIQPSSQAWPRLERRLPARPKNGAVVNMQKWMAIAASLIVLVSSVYFWSSSNKLEFDYMPTIVEELSGTYDCNPFCMLLEGRKELPAYYAAPIREELN